MKSLLSFLLVVAFGAAAYADIQSPPQVDMGPTRKLGRGVTNVIFGNTEILAQMDEVNFQEGNNVVVGYGLIKGVGRTMFRLGVGVWEIATFPAPFYKCSYRQPYPSNIPWIHGGYQEFPPEIGWESRYDYCTP